MHSPNTVGLLKEIKHAPPAPLFQTSTFSGGVSVKTTSGLSHRLYLQSKSCGLACRDVLSPDLIIASGSGWREPVCGRLGNHDAATHGRQESDWANTFQLLPLFFPGYSEQHKSSQDFITAISVGNFRNILSEFTALIGPTSSALCPRTSHLPTVCNIMQHILVLVPVA